MKQSQFNNVFKGLANDATRKDFEMCGWAFINFTDKQVCKVIDLYVERGLATRENDRVYFGHNNAFSYPVSEYYRFGNHLVK